jgi:hypothetical protein
MFIGSKRLQAVVLRPPTRRKPVKFSVPTDGTPRVTQPITKQSSRSFGNLPVPGAVFEPQPPRQGQSLFPVQVKPRDYSTVA